MSTAAAQPPPTPASSQAAAAESNSSIVTSALPLHASRSRKRQLEEAFGSLTLGPDGASLSPAPSSTNVLLRSNSSASYGHATFGSSFMPIPKRHYGDIDRELHARLEALTISLPGSSGDVSLSGASSAPGIDTTSRSLRLSLEMVGLGGQTTPVSTPTSVSFSDALDDGYENEDDPLPRSSSNSSRRASRRKGESPIRRRRRRIPGGSVLDGSPVVKSSETVALGVAGSPASVRLRKSGRSHSSVSSSPNAAPSPMAMGIRTGRSPHHRRHHHTPASGANHRHSAPQPVAHAPLFFDPQAEVRRSSSVSSSSSNTSCAPIGRPSTPTTGANLMVSRSGSHGTLPTSGMMEDGFPTPSWKVGLGRGAGVRNGSGGTTALDIPRRPPTTGFDGDVQMDSRDGSTSHGRGAAIPSSSARGRTSRTTIGDSGSSHPLQSPHLTIRSRSSPPHNRATKTATSPDDSNPNTPPDPTVTSRSMSPPPATSSSKPVAAGKPPLTIGKHGRGLMRAEGSTRQDDDEFGYADDEGGDEEDPLQLSAASSVSSIGFAGEKSRARRLGGGGIGGAARMDVQQRSMGMAGMEEDVPMSLNSIEPIVFPAASSMPNTSKISHRDLPAKSNLSSALESMSEVPGWMGPTPIFGRDPLTFPWNELPRSLMTLNDDDSPTPPSSSMAGYESPVTPSSSSFDIAMGGMEDENRKDRKLPIFTIHDPIGVIGNPKIPSFLFNPVQQESSLSSTQSHQLILYKPIKPLPSSAPTSTSTSAPTTSSTAAGSPTSSWRSARRHSHRVDGNDGDNDGEGMDRRLYQQQKGVSPTRAGMVSAGGAGAGGGSTMELD
ncbi:hypothetical protein HDU96_000821 [Phlyctochytrium bullatum]|nr:hypothetical protein HDU96_000821 [Phlyctochytrium bullatum]